MTQHLHYPASARRIAARVLAAGALAAGALAAGACVSRTLGNQGLERVPATADSAAIGALIVSPSNLALGERILRFDNSGTTEQRATLRKEADRRMSAACAGDYEVGAEGSEAVEGVVTAQPRNAASGPSPFWYIQFTCVRDTPGTTSARQPG